LGNSFFKISKIKIKSKNDNIQLTLNRFIESEEFFYTLNRRENIWRKIKDRIIASIYLGLLNRMPDDEGRATYFQALKKWDDLTTIISNISSGRGHWEKLIGEKSQEIFNEVCEHLLQRKLTLHEIEQAAVRFTNDSTLGNILEAAIRQYYKEEPQIKRRVSPIKKLNQKRIIFLHAEKTGGTTIQSMLSRSLPKNEILCEHDDTIYWRTHADINQYRVLCGHYSHDTTRLLNQGENLLITMVREPGRRILSLYNFWRSHHESHPNYTIYHEIAWQKDFGEFLNDERIHSCRHVWNNMAWYIAGEEVWNEWRSMNYLKEKEQSNFLETTIKPFLEKRMAAFSVVGIQEQFAESVAKIYQLLELEQPSTIPRENSFEENTSKTPNFRKEVMQIKEINLHEKMQIDKLTRIDNIIYQIAQKNFKKK
jgi:hypothetical protein